MSSVRGRGNRDDGMTEYERQKLGKVARNEEIMESLHLRKLSMTLEPPQQNKKRNVSLVE